MCSMFQGVTHELLPNPPPPLACCGAQAFYYNLLKMSANVLHSILQHEAVASLNKILLILQPNLLTTPEIVS